MNARHAITSLGLSLTLAISPVLAEELNTGPADYIHNVAQDANECLMTAEAIDYKYATTTDVCHRFVDNAMTSIRQLDQEYYDHLEKHKPSLLMRVYEDLRNVQKVTSRMKYLSQQ